MDDQNSVKLEPTWRVAKWGDGSQDAEDRYNIFCDAWEITVATDLPYATADRIVADHNFALRRPSSDAVRVTRAAANEEAAKFVESFAFKSEDTGPLLASGIRALLHTPAPALKQGDGVPDGWQLVPKEPTMEMQSAGYLEWNRLRAASATLLYRAMLKAAPRPASSTGGSDER